MAYVGEKMLGILRIINRRNEMYHALSLLSSSHLIEVFLISISLGRERVIPKQCGTLLTGTVVQGERGRMRVVLNLRTYAKDAL